MTNMDRKCKREAQGSTFCKKHHLQTNLDAMQPKNLLDPSEVLHMGEELPNKWVEVSRNQCIT